jgi:hypothetical protein
LSPNKSETSKRDVEENYKSGRWQPEEHQKFLEAIYKFGNDDTEPGSSLFFIYESPHY